MFDRLRRNQRGIVAVEFAIVAPVLILLLLGGIDIGLAIHYQQRMEFAAEAASRCSAIGQCADNVSTTAYAVSSAKINGAEFVATTDTCGQLVVGTYHFNIITLSPAMNLNVSACYPKEKST